MSGLPSPSVLITGCSSGIGEALRAGPEPARAARVRRGSPGRGRRPLRDQSGGRVEPILLDVTDDEAIGRCRSACSRLWGSRAGTPW